MLTTSLRHHENGGQNIRHQVLRQDAYGQNEVEAPRCFENQRLRVSIRIGGHNPTKEIRKFIERAAREVNLSVKSIIHLAKRNKPTLTLLSGPHGHKKSRDQLSRITYGMIVNVASENSSRTSPVSHNFEKKKNTEGEVNPKASTTQRNVLSKYPSQSPRGTWVLPSLRERGLLEERFLRFRNRLRQHAKIDRTAARTETYGYKKRERIHLPNA